MATNEEMLVSAFQENVLIRSNFNLAKMFSYVGQWINFWEQTIAKWPLSDHFSWNMNIKQNVMSHTRITHDKFRTNEIQNGRQPAILIFSFVILEILHQYI